MREKYLSIDIFLSYRHPCVSNLMSFYIIQLIKTDMEETKQTSPDTAQGKPKSVVMNLYLKVGVLLLFDHTLYTTELNKKCRRVDIDNGNEGGGFVHKYHLLHQRSSTETISCNSR